LPGLDFAVFDLPDAIGFFQQAQVMGHQEHGTPPAAAELPEQFDHILTRLAIERRRRLVGKDQFRMAG